MQYDVLRLSSDFLDSRDLGQTFMRRKTIMNVLVTSTQSRHISNPAIQTVPIAVVVDGILGFTTLYISIISAQARTIINQRLERPVQSHIQTYPKRHAIRVLRYNAGGTAADLHSLADT